MFYTNIQLVFLSCFNHVFCTTTLSVPKGNQSVGVFSHLLISDKPCPASFPVPICREVPNGISTLFSILLSKPISALSHTSDNDNFVGNDGKQLIHCFGKTRIVVEVSSAGNDNTEHNLTSLEAEEANFLGLAFGLI